MEAVVGEPHRVGGRASCDGAYDVGRQSNETLGVARPEGKRATTLGGGGSCSLCNADDSDAVRHRMVGCHLGSEHDRFSRPAVKEFDEWDEDTWDVHPMEGPPEAAFGSVSPWPEVPPWPFGGAGQSVAEWEHVCDMGFEIVDSGDEAEVLDCEDEVPSTPRSGVRRHNDLVSTPPVAAAGCGVPAKLVPTPQRPREPIAAMGRAADMDGQWSVDGIAGKARWPVGRPGRRRGGGAALEQRAFHAAAPTGLQYVVTGADGLCTGLSLDVFHVGSGLASSVSREQGFGEAAQLPLEGGEGRHELRASDAGDSISPPGSGVEDACWADVRDGQSSDSAGAEEWPAAARSSASRRGAAKERNRAAAAVGRRDAEGGGGGAPSTGRADLAWDAGRPPGEVRIVQLPDGPVGAGAIRHISVGGSDGGPEERGDDSYEGEECSDRIPVLRDMLSSSAVHYYDVEDFVQMFIQVYGVVGAVLADGLRDTFAHLDDDHDGRVSRAQLLAALNRLRP